MEDLKLHNNLFITLYLDPQQRAGLNKQLFSIHTKMYTGR